MQYLFERVTQCLERWFSMDVNNWLVFAKHKLIPINSIDSISIDKQKNAFVSWRCIVRVARKNPWKLSKFSRNKSSNVSFKAVRSVGSEIRAVRVRTGHVTFLSWRLPCWWCFENYSRLFGSIVERIYIQLTMMSSLSKFKNVRVPLRPIYSTTIPHSTVKQLVKLRNYQTLAIQYRVRRGVLSRHSPLNRTTPFQYPSNYQTRNVGMLVGRILKGALKIRYLLLGGAVGGGISLQRVKIIIQT